MSKPSRRPINADQQAAVNALQQELNSYFKETSVGVDARRAQGTSVLPIRISAGDPIVLDGGVTASGAIYGRFDPRRMNITQADIDSLSPVDSSSAQFKVDLTSPDGGIFLVRVGESFKKLSPSNFRILVEDVLEAVVESAELRGRSSDAVDMIRAGAAIKGAELVSKALLEYFKVPTGPFFAFMKRVVVDPIVELGLDSKQAADYQLTTVTRIKGILAEIATADYQPAQNQITSAMANAGVDPLGTKDSDGDGGSGGGDVSPVSPKPATVAEGGTNYVLWGLGVAVVATVGYMYMKRRD